MSPFVPTRDTITLTIAGPPTFVSANSRGGWYVHDKAIAAWRAVAANTARRARIATFPGRVTIDVTVHRTSNRKSDASNVFPSIKAAVDGFQDARILAGDDDAHVAALTIRRGPNTAHPTLTITITTEGKS